ncbi:hypothetical protein [Coxiella-like endosymbiont]|nr:hypothetical protein [Coxiella-like endosymbiont]
MLVLLGGSSGIGKTTLMEMIN